MLAKEHHGEEILLFAPTHDVHHRLGIGLWKCTIHLSEKLLVMFTTAALDKQRRSGIICDMVDAFILIEPIDFMEIAAQPLPLLL